MEAVELVFYPKDQSVANNSYNFIFIVSPIGKSKRVFYRKPNEDGKKQFFKVWNYISIKMIRIVIIGN